MDHGQRPEFSFLAVSDLHYQGDACRPWLERAFRQMRSEPEEPEFCLVLGDLTDAGTREQLAGVRSLLEDLGRPIYPVIGNHDFHPDDGPHHYRRAFPGRINYQFEHRDWLFVGLDTCEGLPYEDTSVQPPTLDWLDRTLPHLDPAAPMVVFTHFPLGPGVPMRPLNADEVLRRFARHNLKAVLSGHFHGLTERRAGETLLVTGRCCSAARDNHDGSHEKGYLLCTAYGSRLRYRFRSVP